MNLRGIYIKNQKILSLNIEKNFIINNNNSLIKVLYCGVCGSDLHRIKDKNFEQNNFLGHEIVGLVEESYNKELIGSKVVINPLISCGGCNSCKSGNTNLCLNIKGIGRNLDGGFIEKIVVPNSNIYKLDLLENKGYLGVFVDSIAVVIHGIKLLGDIGNLKKIAIIGGGTIGLISAFYLKKILGNNIIIDVYYRNNKEYYNNFKDFNFKKIGNFNKNSYDLSIETVGGQQSKTINDLILKTKLKGKILSFGVFKEKYLLEINIRELLYKEITLIGSNSFIVNSKEDDFKEAIFFLQENITFFCGLLNNFFNINEKNGIILYDDFISTGNKGTKNIIKF